MEINITHADYNIFNYVEDMNSSFDESGFNEVDGLVLSQMSNMKFEGVNIDIHTGSPKTIADVYNEMQITGTPANDVYNSMGPNEKKLLGLMAGSDRYKDLTLSNYVNNPVTGGKSTVDGFTSIKSEDASMEQFAAVTITYKQDGKTYNYMSFQATNDTTDGWTEDFAMLSKVRTQAQQDSVDYMNIVGPQLEGYLTGGGHSKGANDFEYGYLFCNDSVRKRIVKGYVYDGPGLSDDVLALTDRYGDFQKIIKGTFVCPQDSMVGQLLTENKDATFIHSVEAGFEQHDPYTWEINPGTMTFVPDEQTETSKLFNEVTDICVKNLSPEERDAFFEFVRYLMYNNGGESLGGIADFFSKGWDDPKKKLKEILPVIIDAYQNMTPEQQKEFRSAVGTLISTLIVYAKDKFVEDVKSWAEKKIDEFKQKVHEIWESACDWIEEKKQALKQFLTDVYKTVSEKIKEFARNIKKISSGYKYASANPYISLDTYKLTQYAQRLRNVNKRLRNVDRRMDSLYWKVDISDRWIISQADVLTGESYRLNRCISYLESTSSDFSKTEDYLKKLL